MKQKKVKTYVLTVSQIFPKKHRSEGQKTKFVESIREKIKLHTIRMNYELWAKRFDEIKKGNAILSVRVWEGKPYNSKQIKVFDLNHTDGIGVEKLDLTPLGFFVDEIENDLTVSDLAKNDGLSKPDFSDWFNGSISIDMPPKAIIHFSHFRYKKEIKENESFLKLNNE